MATGSISAITETIHIPTLLGKQGNIHPFLILPGVIDDVILGYDFLKAMGTTISIGETTTCVCKQGPNEGPKPIVNLHIQCTEISPEGSQQNAPQTPQVHTALSLKEREEQIRIQEFVARELKKFEGQTGVSNITEHRIVMKDNRPTKQRYYPRNPAMQAIIDEEIDDLLKKDCIERSYSPYSAPIVITQKPSGGWRLCVDYRQLNEHSIPDAYPLPRINHILTQLGNGRYFTTLDLKSGYWQIPMANDSKAYTAFTVPGRGLYQWKVMPFGLHSAPATFQRALDRIIGPEMEPYAFAYLDDIVVVGSTFEEHARNLKEVLRRLKEANLKLNVDKCEFFKREIRYLGHIISEKGIHTDPEKIKAIKELKPPQNLKEVRRVIGIASWYRRFVPEFADIVQPMNQLLKKGKHWKWTEEHQQSFELLKTRLTEAPILACPDFTKTFTLQTDASDYGLGVALTQEIDGVERVIAYASRSLNKAERNYSTTEKECLAIVWGIRQMKMYLEGYEFVVITDHLSLKWLNSIENPSGRIARWALELQQFRFTVKYRKGKLNVVADALSRQPLEALRRTIVSKEPVCCSWYDQRIQEVRESPDKFPDYNIVDGQLYRHIPNRYGDDDCPNWKLCVPKWLRNQVLRENHDEATAGHLGTRKTTVRTMAKYYWPGLARDVRQYVRSCNSCQQFKPSQQKPVGTMLTQIPEEPWSVVCADFVGPLPRSKHGNNILLVFLDKFSKWVEMVPLRTATAETLKKAFRERIIARFGVPKVMVTDNGVQFTSRCFTKYLEELGIRHQFTAPYTPQENPTERANRTIKTMIAQYTGEDHRQWDEVIPELTLAINSSVSETTGFSATFLVQGREPRLPGALFDKLTIGTGTGSLSIPEREAQLKETFQLVRRNLEKAAADQAHHYNLRRRPSPYKVGDLVWVKRHILSSAPNNFAAKLAEKFDGPYRIESFKSPAIVKLKHRASLRPKTANLNDLKPFTTTTSP